MSLAYMIEKGEFKNKNWACVIKLDTISEIEHKCPSSTSKYLIVSFESEHNSINNIQAEETLFFVCVSIRGGTLID